MSELTITLLRLGYLVLLWLFVLSAISVLRRDLYGTKIVTRRTRRPAENRAPAPVGGPQPSPGPEREAPFPRRDSTPRKLVVTAGPLRGTTIPLGASAVLIGRAPSCTLVLDDDDYSSSRHARLFPEGGQWYVEDLGSTNGTFVGRERVDAPVAVTVGSQIKVGQSVLELQR